MLQDETHLRAETSATLRLRSWSPYFTVIAVFATIAAFDLSDGKLFLGDIDDRLRAVQIRQFLGGKGWYDLTFSGIAMPGPYVSPWSRMVDAPYAAIAWLLTPLTGSVHSLALAFDLWPPILMLAFAGFSVATMVGLMPRGSTVRPLHAVVAALAMAYASLEFVPGRIDHHSVQLVTLAAASYGIVCWSRAGGILVALSFVLSMTVGLETLPLIAALWAGLTLAWIARRPGADPIFRAFSLAVAVLSPLVTLVIAGPAVLFSVQNDIFSAPYVMAFAGFGLISFATASFLRDGSTIWMRFIALAVPGLLLLSAIAMLMPHVLAGPYAIIDPLSRRLWLDRVDQEHSVLLLVRSGSAMALASLALQSVVLVFAGRWVLRELHEGRTAAALLLFMGAAAFVANLAAYRFIRFPAALLPLFLPVLLTWFSAASLALQKRAILLAALAALSASVVFEIAARAMPVTQEPGTLDASDFLMLDTCLPQDRTAMAGLPAGRYMVTPAVGLTFLEAAPGTVEVADISYHRASPGMHRMFEALYEQDSGQRRQALRPFDYVAFCAFPSAVKAMFTPPSGSLFAGLLNGNPGAAFTAVPVPGAIRLNLYRIDHARL